MLLSRDSEDRDIGGSVVVPPPEAAFTACDPGMSQRPVPLRGCGDGWCGDTGCEDPELGGPGFARVAVRLGGPAALLTLIFIGLGATSAGGS